MAITNVNFRMDEELKKQLEEVCDELGMNMTTAFTIFAKKVCREKRIPFDISVDPLYSESSIRHILESENQIREGHVVFKTLEELEEMARE